MQKEDIKCSQFFCDEQVLNLCCKCCAVRELCNVRCFNDPEKCGLQAKKNSRKSLSNYVRIPMRDEK